MPPVHRSPFFSGTPLSSPAVTQASPCTDDAWRSFGLIYPGTRTRYCDSPCKPGPRDSLDGFGRALSLDRLGLFRLVYLAGNNGVFRKRFHDRDHNREHDDDERCRSHDGDGLHGLQAACDQKAIAIAAWIAPQRIFLAEVGFMSPSEEGMPRTKVPEFAEVMKKVSSSTRATTHRAKPPK